LISNALTKVRISGTEYAVIEAIERKNSIKYEQSFRDTMRAELAQCKQNMEQNRLTVDKNIQNMIEASLGKVATPSKEDYEAIAGPYTKTHELKLLDPCKVEEKINDLDEKIEDFLKEVDICLTESNSRTEIEVPD
jgi:tetrahydromethanopterin S-methyltransferase subunit B